MSFTNPPLQGKPPANPLGLQAMHQIEREARSNQIVPSADIMVRRTTKGTLLSLRGKGVGGGGNISLVTVGNYRFNPTNTSAAVWDIGESFFHDENGNVIATPPIDFPHDPSTGVSADASTAVLGPATGGWRWPKHGSLVGGESSWWLERGDAQSVVDPGAHGYVIGEPVIVMALAEPLKIPLGPLQADPNFGTHYTSVLNSDGRACIEALYLDLNTKWKTWRF